MSSLKAPSFFTGLFGGVPGGAAVFSGVGGCLSLGGMRTGALARALCGVRAVLSPAPVGDPVRAGNARARLPFTVKSVHGVLFRGVPIGGRSYLRRVVRGLAAGAFPAAP